MKIFVNGRTKEIGGMKKITYDGLMLLAFGYVSEDKNILLTVTFECKSGKGGSLLKNEEIDLEEGMIFNVTATNRA